MPRQPMLYSSPRPAHRHLLYEVCREPPLPHPMNSRQEYSPEFQIACCYPRSSPPTV